LQGVSSQVKNSSFVYVFCVTSNFSPSNNSSNFGVVSSGIIVSKFIPSLGVNSTLYNDVKINSFLLLLPNLAIYTVLPHKKYSRLHQV